MFIDLKFGNCQDLFSLISDGTVDAVISDPPYPEIDRDYGRMSESDWFGMMKEVVTQTKRILKPTGSAVFVLQPNSEKVGKMRLWLWRFLVWCGEYWNIVQDAYWWNYATLPTSGVTQYGLMRGTVKTLVWLGQPYCYRSQESVLWQESDSNKMRRIAGRSNIARMPSGHSVDVKRCVGAAERRGGVTPFNLLPLANSNNTSSSATFGHGAGTPFPLVDWWTRYICPKGGVVADWFMGAGTMGLAALKNECSFIGIEKEKKYFDIAKERIEKEFNSVKNLALI